MTAQAYRHLVEADGPRVNRHKLYDGPDAADAMAAWSQAVSDGAEYVMLETLAVAEPWPVSLREREPGSEIRLDGESLRTRCGHSFATCHTDRCFRGQAPDRGRVSITMQHGPRMAAHDGFAAHSHEVRQDHDGVPRTQD